MTDATFRARLFAVVDGVVATENVNDKMRFFNSYDEYKKAFSSTATREGIHGWMVELTNIDDERPSRINGGVGAEIFRNYTYTILGYFSLNDSLSSFSTFATIAESVTTALNSDSTLHTSSDDYWNAPPCSLTLEPVEFGGVLCHRATIQQEIVKKVTT